jgi:hypothetical protein
MVVCCQVEVSATSWSLVQSSPSDGGASLCVIKNPRGRGGHSPRWAAVPEKIINNEALYMFWALLAHLYEAFQKRHLVYCVRVMSGGCTSSTSILVHMYHKAYAQFYQEYYLFIRILWAPWRWRSCSAETRRSKIDILNIWFTLKMHFVGLSFVIIWKCMVQATKINYKYQVQFV